MFQYIRTILFLIVFLNISKFDVYGQPYNEYEIYSTIINNKEINWTNKNTILVIRNVELGDDSNELLNYLKADQELILSSFFDDESIKKYETDQNYQDAILGLLKTSPQKIEIKSFVDSIFNLKPIRKRKFHSFFKRDIIKGWDQIDKKFQSNWVVEFSKVSFSGNYAAVYYGYYCGGLCGSGQLLVLEKKESTNWQIISKINLWNH
ncbi:hypothetical protein P3875_08715 [Myroides sp. JBRI-B21084]|uniref:hypothetical protein n=1 Tax=Myroides sp. JBRI-B21084 TaxID=3119977 RepID=UPI0026E4867E|nr:hypothetical protein [Paenimyroides cloacae]WKW45858.1 hypothetical protein P3875_08715 [Paenimyroides cloacae]